MAKIIETVYHEPSEEYPGLNQLGIKATTRRVLDAKLALLVQVNAEIKAKVQEKAGLTDDVIKLLQDNDIDSEKFWSTIPWSLRYSESSKLDPKKLLQLGVKASVIAAATTKNKAARPSLYPIAPRGEANED